MIWFFYVNLVKRWSSMNFNLMNNFNKETLQETFTTRIGSATNN